MPDLVAGFDIGGTKTSLVVVDPSETALHRSVEPTATQPGPIDRTDDRISCYGLSEQLARMLETALRSLPQPQLRAIGIVSAGPIRDGGLWNPPNIHPEGIAGTARDLPRSFPLIDPLREAFSCPTGLLNDCNGAALGEVYYGLGRDVPDRSALYLAYVTISTGFGVGVWDGGRLVLGKDGSAGEIGHIVARAEGLPCGCGNRGCVEAYASGAGIARNARRRLASAADRAGSVLFLRLTEIHGPEPLDSLLDRVAPPLVFEAAGRGDPIAQAVIDDAIYAAAIGLAATANAYDPAIISVGGGIALAHPKLLDPIRREMLRHLNVRPPEVRLSPLRERVTEWGAIALARGLVAG